VLFALFLFAPLVCSVELTQSNVVGGNGAAGMAVTNPFVSIASPFLQCLFRHCCASFLMTRVVALASVPDLVACIVVHIFNVWLCLLPVIVVFLIPVWVRCS